MRKDLKDQWIAELRSGKHKQVFGKMKTPDGCMCALGVLGEIMDPTAWRPTVVEFSNRNPFLEWKGDNLQIQREAKMSSIDAEMIILLNDQHHLPFTAIADQIERYVTSE